MLVDTKDLKLEISQRKQAGDYYGDPETVVTAKLAYDGVVIAEKEMVVAS